MKYFLFIIIKPRAILKNFSVFIFVLITSKTSFAQSTLIIEGSTPKLFLSHKVSPKENFYSVGRKYNISPKELASYNNLQFEKGLNVGEIIKIPLTQNNFSQAETAVPSKNLVPLYHVVVPKEGLYRISISYDKVPLSLIKKWNHLSSDEVSIGASLIVGFLKTDKADLLLEPKTNVAIKEVTEVSKNSDKPQPTTQAPIAEKAVQANEGDAEKQVQKEAIADQSKVSANNSSPAKTTINFSGGYFKKSYDDQVSKKSIINDGGNASVFRSTSGWQDGKYYCFNNDAPPGTIIKITNNATNKSVYAKVLDAIPDIKQNASLTVIVSNAAAEELGAGEKFSCLLSYAK